MSAQEYDLNSQENTKQHDTNVALSAQPKPSVEEAFYEWEKSLKHGYGRVEIWKAGHTHATKDANLMPLDKVVEVLEENITAYRKVAESEADNLIKNISFGVAIELQNLITQIKNLTKG